MVEYRSQAMSVPAGLMIASQPEAKGSPAVVGSQYVEPLGSTTSAPNRPWFTAARKPGPGLR